MQRRHVAAADAVFLLGEHDDGAAFGRFVRSEASWAASARSCAVDAGQRHEFGRLPVAERDGAGLVEQQRVHVARRFDRAAGHGEHVEAHKAVHAGDADGGEQRADGRGDQGHEQRDQHEHGDAPPA